VLVTGWDIIFFWVARMIFAGYEFKNEKPFHDVYFTGMVRDLQRRKMSKSLGNSPDALGLIDKYGADGVRFGMLSCAAAGNDLLFDEKLCEQGRNFSNKLWNAHNLLSGWEIKEGENKENEAAILWFESKLNKTIVSLEESFKTYRLSEALMNLYNFIWNDFCSSYLEFIKPDYQQPIDRNTYNKTVEFFDTLMQLLHPFMPFITEELWQSIAERESICLAAYPKAASFDEQAILKGEYAKEIITAVREIRNKNSIKNKDVLDAFVLKGGDDIYSDFSAKILKLGNLSTLTEIETEVANSASFIVKGRQFFVSIGNNIDVDAKKAELEKELEYTKGFVASIEKKLSNERFVQNAPEKVIEMERQKLADGKAKINLLQESIGNLK
jgi:valyl-tRNA synthetase